MRYYMSGTIAVLLAVAAPSGAIAKEFVDTETMRIVRNEATGFRACPQGFVVTGVDIAGNRLLCSDDFGRWSPSLEDISPITPQRCPQGWAMTGRQASTARLLCAPIAEVPKGRYSSTTREGMPACPLGQMSAPMSGFDASTNTWVCGHADRGPTVTVNTTADEYDATPNGRCSLREAIQTIRQGRNIGGCARTLSTGKLDGFKIIKLPPGVLSFSLGNEQQLGFPKEQYLTVSIEGAGKRSATSGTMIDGSALKQRPGLYFGWGVFTVQGLTIANVSARRYIYITRDGKMACASDAGAAYSHYTATLLLKDVEVRNSVNGIRTKPLEQEKLGFYLQDGQPVKCPKLGPPSSFRGYVRVVDGWLHDNQLAGVECFSHCDLLRTDIRSLRDLDEAHASFPIVVWNSSARIEASTLSGAHTHFAAGLKVFGESADVEVLNSTISENWTHHAGGGIYVVPVDICTPPATKVTTRVTISNSTITKNLTGVLHSGRAAVEEDAKEPNEGGGIYLQNLDVLNQANLNSFYCQAPYVQILPADWSPAVEVSNSIIAGNSKLIGGSVLDGTKIVQTNNCYGSLTSLGGNIWGPQENLPGECTRVQREGVDQVEVNEASVLNPTLANTTVGSTRFHALPAGSPAIDRGRNDLCPSTDQRGLSRPVDGDGNGSAVCDVGAVEYR